MGQWDGIASPISPAADKWAGIASPVATRNDSGEGSAGQDRGAANAFAGGIVDVIPGAKKIAAGIDAAALYPFKKGTYNDLYKQQLADDATTSGSHPIATGAGLVSGVASAAPIFKGIGTAAGALADAIPGGKAVTGALSSLGTPAADAGYVSKAANLGIRAAKGAAGAAPVGALYGAANDTTGHMGEAAAEGAEVAGALGAGLPVAAAGLGAVADVAGPAARAVASKVAPAYAAQAEQDVAMGKIIKRINADFPDPVERQAALEKAINTPGIGLAEALGGKNTTNLASGAAQYPEGKAAAQSYIDMRASGSPGRIAKTFADQVSSNTDYFGTLDGITEKGRAAAGPFYDKAYAANKAVVSPEIDKILDTPAGKQALSAARTKMLNDQSMMGVPDKELGEQARDAVRMGQMAENPKGGVAAGLNLRSLDYVKRSLDDQISAAYRAGENDNARIISGLKNNLVSALDNADETGAYAKARQVSGDYIRNKNAMDDGRDFMKPGTAGQPEQIAAKFKALGPTEQESYKAGMVRAVKEAMDRPSADQPNYYTKVFGSADMQNRLKAVLNENEFNVLSKNMQAEQELYKFKYDILGNSRTAEKQISAQEFENGGKEIYQDLINNGSPTRTAVKALTKWVGSMFDGISNKTAGQVSKILYETDPAKKLEILKSIQKNSQLEPAEKQTAFKAYYSINSLFKNLSKTQAGVNNGEENE